VSCQRGFRQGKTKIGKFIKGRLIILKISTAR
jgi:hypothetical protein